MDWLAKAFVIWRRVGDDVPDPADFRSDEAAEWHYALEAVGDIYSSLENGRGAKECPWLMTEEGVIYGPSDLNSFRPLWDAYVERNGRFGPEVDFPRE
jgi:hypothetical protein